MSQEQWMLVEKVVDVILPVITALIGVWIGAHVADRNQRKQWVADNKKREYQELITALTHAFSAMLNRAAPLVAYGPQEQRAFAATEEQALIAITDRIFIREEVDTMNVLKRWQELVRNINATGDTNALSNAMGDIKSNLVYEARKLMG